MLIIMANVIQANNWMFLGIFSIIEKIIKNVLIYRFDGTEPVVGTNNASNCFGQVSKWQ